MKSTHLVTAKSVGMISVLLNLCMILITLPFSNITMLCFLKQFLVLSAKVNSVFFYGETMDFTTDFVCNLF